MTQEVRRDREAERREEEEEYAEERRYLVGLPVVRYFALVVGLTLTSLGILGFIPWLAAGGVLLGLLRVTPLENAVHLVTGAAGLLVFFVLSSRYARIYALAVAVIYLVVFTAGNIAFANAQGRATSAGIDIPWILDNALHAGLMLTGALIAGLSSLQRGDRATAREHDQQRGKYTPS